MAPMIIVRRLLLVSLLLLGVIRLLRYLEFASMMLAYPLESYFLEAKMVLLAYRVELGESLYPAWRDYPHVANFFGPLYFGLVGILGRWSGADIPGLFSIGRALTFGSAVLTTLLIAWVVARRSGYLAGITAGVLSLGASPMYGFSVMVRPDMLAELLGIGGFLLSSLRHRSGVILGGLLIVLSILSKQTAVVFLAASCLALVVEGERIRARNLLGGVLAVLAVVFGIGSLVGPNFVPSLLAEGKTPWDLLGWALTLRMIRDTSP
ncbi:hypothetical protein ACYOEI_37935, partial [Singulisphaera rosea]